MLAVQVQYLNYEEAKRHNLVTEQQGFETLKQGAEGLRIQGFNADTQRMSQEEQARHNKASETISIASLEETERHNRAYEAETARHNVASENIGMQQARAATLSANASMTSAQASLKNAQLNETKWNNSGYYLEQTERLKNLAQKNYYESQSTTGIMGAVGSLIGGVGRTISSFF